MQGKSDTHSPTLRAAEEEPAKLKAKITDVMKILEKELPGGLRN